jgi:hypothetical protein
MDFAGRFVTTGWADCPVAWLEKIDPVKTNTTQEKEIAA